ncbi:MAG: hypothetical protein AAFQ01_02600, partial [Bacteroidota bacterium]
MPSRLNNSVIVGIPVLLVGLCIIYSACDNPTMAPLPEHTPAPTNPTGNTDGGNLNPDSSTPAAPAPSGPPNPGTRRTTPSPAKTPEELAVENRAKEEAERLAQSATDTIQQAVQYAGFAGEYFRAIDNNQP